MRRAKVDGNQRAIVQALRAAGCTVQTLAAVGQGCPDLAVGRGGRTYLLEVKTATGKLRACQAVWRSNWNGQVATVRSPEEALAVVGKVGVARDQDS